MKSKICTSLEQSKKLKELGLNVNTADMCWTNHLFYGFLSSWRVESTPPNEYKNLLDRFIVKGYLIEPAWSLSALVDMLDDTITDVDGHTLFLHINKEESKYDIRYTNSYTGEVFKTKHYENIIDAAFEMVCWLLGNKKL